MKNQDISPELKKQMNDFITKNPEALKTSFKELSERKEFERIGAVQLGVRIDKNFLKGIIPDEWEQKTYDGGKFYSVKVRRVNKTKKTWYEEESEFNEIVKALETELKDNFMEVYSITSGGNHFVVYLRK